ncbi:MAG TPA: hypothetical protein VGM41_00965 [Chitinophagaceae bacterium]
MKSHRHILSKRARVLHREQVKNQGRLADLPEKTVVTKTTFAPTLLKNITDKARRRVLRTASRIASWYKK